MVCLISLPTSTVAYIKSTDIACAPPRVSSAAELNKPRLSDQSLSAAWCRTRLSIVAGTSRRSCCAAPCTQRQADLPQAVDQVVLLGVSLGRCGR